MSETYAGPPPPFSSLGAWLLNKVEELAESIRGLVDSRSEDTAKVNELVAIVTELRSAVERSAKIQDIQAIELEQIKAVTRKTQKQLNGIKVSRGKHKA